MSHMQNFIPLLGEQLFPSCGANKNKQKQIAPQAVEWKNESLHRQKTSKTNCSTGCGAEKTNRSTGKKRAKTNHSTGRKMLPPTAPKLSDSSDTTVSFVDHIPSPNIIAEFYGRHIFDINFHELVNKSSAVN